MPGFTFHPIATIHSPFKEKFGVPRQSGVVTAAHSTIELLPPYNRPEAVEGLEGFSHLWLQFIFHLNLRSEWQPMVRPPRLGGNKKVGVFASRAPFRPNPIGLSAVKIESIQATQSAVCIEVSGADLVDGTPIIDIKPYIPYADSIPHASGGFAQTKPEPRFAVQFSAAALQQLETLENGEALQHMIQGVLAIDPRPAYRSDDSDHKEYGILLDNFNIKWKVSGATIEVTTLIPV